MHRTGGPQVGKAAEHVHYQSTEKHLIILWIVGAIGLLSSIVILILNWSHPLIDRRQRRSDRDLAGVQLGHHRRGASPPGRQLVDKHASDT